MRFVGRYQAKESKPRKSTTYIRRRTNSGLDGLSGRNRILDVFLLIIYQQNRRYNQLPGLRAPSHWRIVVETYGRRRAASRRLPRDSLLRPRHSYTLTLHARWQIIHWADFLARKADHLFRQPLSVCRLVFRSGNRFFFLSLSQSLYFCLSLSLF